MSISFESVAVSSFDEARRIVTGEANKEAPHLTVPFYMPLAQSVTLEDALKWCRPVIRKAVKEGKAQLLAIAHGTMAGKDSSRPVQFVLIHGKLNDEAPDLYLNFDFLEDEIECAVLMDGDGIRFSDNQPLSQQEAVAFWMGGFLNWNEKCPGLYWLRYALIES